jgi:hypothetical protein
MTKGRKRKAGKREPNGRIARPSTETVEQDAMRTAIAYRQTVLGVSARDAKDQKATSLAGRLCLKGVISNAQWQAGEDWLALLNAMGAAVNAPRGIINRLVSLTVGTCSCETKSPELKYHTENCRYRVASEALELASALYTSPPSPPEPKMAADIVERVRLVALLAERDGSEFDGEVHLSSEEAERIVAAMEADSREIVAQATEIETLRKRVGEVEGAWNFNLSTAPRDRDFLIQYDHGEVTVGHYLDNSKTRWPFEGVRPCRSMRPERIKEKILAWRDFPRAALNQEEPKHADL